MGLWLIDHLTLLFPLLVTLQQNVVQFIPFRLAGCEGSIESSGSCASPLATTLVPLKEAVDGAIGVFSSSSSRLDTKPGEEA